MRPDRKDSRRQLGGPGWDGKASDKAKALVDLKSQGISLDSVEIGPMKVRIFGATAIVTGRKAVASESTNVLQYLMRRGTGGTVPRRIAATT